MPQSIAILHVYSGTCPLSRLHLFAIAALQTQHYQAHVALYRIAECVNAVTGVHTHESHCWEAPDAPCCSGGDPVAPEQDHCRESSGNVPLESPIHVSPCSSRKSSQYTPTGLCGWWASIWSRPADAQPSKQELRGRRPGEDGSRPVRCTLDSTTGVQYA